MPDVPSDSSDNSEMGGCLKAHLLSKSPLEPVCALEESCLCLVRALDGTCKRDLWQWKTV